MEKHKDEACDYYEIHEDSMEIINKTMPEETELEDLADLFKIFGDSTRIRILFVLFETEVCVCDLAKALNMTQSAISHQLRILKQNKLVKNRREGKSIFYQSGKRAYRRKLIRCERMVKVKSRELIFQVLAPCLKI